MFSEGVGSKHQGYLRDRAIKIKIKFLKIIEVKYFSHFN